MVHMNCCGLWIPPLVKGHYFITNCKLYHSSSIISHQLSVSETIFNAKFCITLCENNILFFFTYINNYDEKIFMWHGMHPGLQTKLMWLHMTWRKGGTKNLIFFSMFFVYSLAQRLATLRHMFHTKQFLNGLWMSK